MIPEKLQLRNFMSYRDTVPILEFDGIHVACLSGENGAGKSALLDAITWALWGKSRVSSDDELIAQGAQEMEVDFQFGLNNSSYRVLRRRSSAKRGQTILDLQVADAKGWRTISGNNVRETQGLIIDLLRMEYDTFINSAFLVQGKADEFTRKPPSERKRVLAEILSLNEYERLETRAKDQARDFDEQAKGKEALIEELRRQVERRDFLIEQEQLARERVAVLQNTLDGLRQQVEKITEHRRQLEARRSERDELHATLQTLQREIAEARAEHAELSQELTTARTIVARSAEIEAGAGQLAAAQAEVQRLDLLLEQAYQIIDRKKSVQAQIDKEETRLALDLEQTKKLIAAHHHQLANREALEAQYAEAKAHMQALETLDTDLGAARQARENLEHQYHILRELEVQRERLLGQIAVAKDSLIAAREEQNRRVADYDASLRNEERWREELATATAQQRTLSRDERRLAELRAQDQHDSQRLGELTARTEAFKQQGDEINKKLDWLSHSGDTTCPLCQSEIGHNGIAQIEQTYIAERDDLRTQWREMDTEAKGLQRDLDARRREMYGLERKLEDLKSITAKVARLENDLRDAEEQRKRRADAEATMLDLDGRINSDDFAHKERATLSHVEADLAALGFDQPLLDQQRTAMLAEIQGFERQIQQRSQITAQVAILQGQLEALKTTANELASLEEQALTQQTKLDLGDFAGPERSKLQAIQTELEHLGYGKNAHNLARQAVADLQHWGDEMQMLRDVRGRIANDERHLLRLEQLIARSEQERIAKQALWEQAQAEVIRLPAVASEAERVRRDHDDAQRKMAVAQQEWGAAQEKVVQVEQLAEQLVVHEQDYETLLERREIYTELARAFGKKGIQAMLIETAIPELERETNDLLGRMTDYQMHVRFETIRETKKGDTSETLEIHISDAHGTRRYDLYSGGEAFRINFAIRIALSKLLARRAGANLQTLIIDEGFGSQDGRGRERLVEAINSIQQEFKRILVITHIQELKDMFPIQIEITKTELGSRWNIN